MLKEFRKSADAGDPKAAVALGEIYYSGKLAGKDLKAALRLFEAAAAKNDPDAFYWLSYLYFNGEGVSANSDKRLSYLEKAAKFGNRRAQMDMGNRFVWPSEKEEPQTAIFWFEKAALQGDIKAIDRVIELLDKSENRLKTERSRSFWIKTGAEQGIAMQQWRYALMLEKGNGVTKDSRAAFKFAFLAAGNGIEQAEQIVGLMMLRSEKFSENQKRQAVAFIRSAAKKGNNTAQFTLAELFSSGYQVKKDWTIALMWAFTARHNGYNGSENIIKFAKKKLVNKYKIDQARRLSQQCIESRYGTCER